LVPPPASAGIRASISMSLQDATKLFTEYDEDGGGTLDHTEVKNLLADAGFQVDEGYINGLLDAFDLDGSGDIDQTEFEALFTALIGRGGHCIRTVFI